MPVAVVIRCIPDELFARVIPSFSRRRKDGPELLVEDEEAQVRRWNPGVEEIREELTFLKKIRGGRMSELAYKLQHPRESMLPRSRSPSRSRSDTNLPQTPDGDLSFSDAVTSPVSPATPERARKRTRAGSNAFGPAAAMAGIVAGSIAGAWSPIDRRGEDPGETIRFSRSRSHSGVEGTAGMEIHPATAATDPVFAESIPQDGIPPSQNPDLAPHFEHAPPHSPSGRTKSSHSRQPSSNA